MKTFSIQMNNFALLVNMRGLLAASTGLLRPLRALHYVQGQSPEPKVREYFYYIDHQGQLFLDDAKIKNFTSCFKDFKLVSKDNLPLWEMGSASSQWKSLTVVEDNLQFLEIKENSDVNDFLAEKYDNYRKKKNSIDL